MGRLTRNELQVERLLRAARSIAILDARPEDAVAEYLRAAGYEVFPIRPDRAEVAGLPSLTSLADVPGRIDILLVRSGSVLDRAIVEEAARKGARALWLPPGVTAREIDATAAEHGLMVVRDLDIVTEHGHTEQVAGQPRKRGVHVAGRKRAFEDDRKRIEETGYVPGGGGGHKGGGGRHAVLDEKKMIGGKPSPRTGRLRRRGS